MTPRVYLAGPIVGCTNDEANQWRKQLSADLTSLGLVGVSPLRCEPLIGERYNLTFSDDPRFGTAKAIGAKNLVDVRRCDIVLAYLPVKHQSVGTIIEIGMAFAFGKPVIIVTNNPKIRDHPDIKLCAGWVLETFDEALDVLEGVFTAYVGG